MSDIRTRLTDALAAELELRRGTVQTWGAHIADVLLSLPGVAIVELPDLDAVADLHIAYSRGADCEHDCCPPGVRDVDVDVDYSLSEARAFAAALLAAANAAEQPVAAEL